METKKNQAMEKDDEMEDDEKKVEVVVGLGGRGSSGGGSGSGGVAPPCCQVEKCGVDLSAAKRYHKRHKVCESHAKATVVIVSGLCQRFCQQCSRFHEVTEFDEAKRSCRIRLAGHNERRRKMASEVCGAGSSRKSGSNELKESQYSLAGNSGFNHFQIK